MRGADGAGAVKRSIDLATILFILGIILFILLVVVHELGHAIVAKRNGVVVEEFGIFFPPRLWAKKLKNGVLFTINALPLGGFVKLQGESDDANKKGDYGAASLWVKTKILLAGVGVNWLTAALLFTVMAWSGLPQVLPNQFTVASDTSVAQQNVIAAQIAENSPAAQIGLEQGDIITKLDGQEVTSAEGLAAATQAKAGQEVSISYLSDDKPEQATVTLRGPDAKNGQLGVAPGQQTYRQSTWSAPIVGVGLTAQLTWETLKGLGGALGNLFVGIFQSISFSEASREAGGEALQAAGSNVAGPVGIVNFLLQTAENAGLSGVLFIVAIISLSLALINTLPIPALDGGRLFVTLLFRGLKKPLTKPLEEKIHASGFMALIALIIVITVVDINRLSG